VLLGPRFLVEETCNTRDMEDTANVSPDPHFGVSGVPKSTESAIDLAAAIGAACNTPHPTSVPPVAAVGSGSEPTTPCDSEPARHNSYNEDFGPGMLSDEATASPEEETPNGDIDLCRRAVLLQPQEEDVCSICLDEFTEDDPGQSTTCGHLYHLQCVMQWAQRSRECPLCFRALQLEDEEMNSLLPFGEYTPPPGPGTSNNAMSSLAQHMYGIESLELQVLHRFASPSQQVPPPLPLVFRLILSSIPPNVPGSSPHCS